MQKETSKSLYTQISERRKKEQEEGLLPNWVTTAGAQLYYSKYEYDTNGRSFRAQAERIAKTAARHLPNPEKFEDKFFNLIWNGWLSCSTPVLANMGTDRGCPVSCTGNVIDDSVIDFYKKQAEVATLTKNGFGTASYLGDIRPRGTSIAGGGKASGVLPVLKDFIQLSRDVSQGSTRRGAWAGYLPIDHGDFWEVANFLESEPDDANIGWCIYDSTIKLLDSGDEEMLKRWQKILKIKALNGKGYLFFPDKVNRVRPESYVNNNLLVKTSQLCSEITLFSGIKDGEEHSFSCVLSSMNLTKYDEWRGTDAVFNATIFLDCVAQEFIDIVRNRIAKKNPEEAQAMMPVVRYTEKARSLGLGACGLHTLFQEKGISFESFEAHSLNTEIFSYIRKEADRASEWMAKELGEPEWCIGTGKRNTHVLAVAPTKSCVAKETRFKLADGNTMSYEEVLIKNKLTNAI